jgi:hypothetical protein
VIGFAVVEGQSGDSFTASDIYTVEPNARDARSWLRHLLEHPDQAADVPADALPSVLITLAGLHATLAARLASSPTQGAAEADELMTVDQASAMLGGVSRDFLYKSPSARGMRVKLGGRVLFSRAKAQAYIKARAGRV